METKQIVDENFKGLDELINDEDLTHFYKSLIETCLDEYASPLKERIKELEENNKNLQTLVQKHLNREYFESTNELHDYIEKLQSQLKEADSKAVRFAEWINENEEYISTHPTRANLWLYKDKEVNSDELFEIFESENK